MADSTLYTPIPTTDDSQFIRVLDVHVPLKDHDEAIHATLKIVDLKSNPSFSTLSYVWGSPDGKHQFVHCGPHQIPLLSNGYSALKALRKKLGAFTIWIDAICINQNDDNEKQRQIPLMGDIYSKAASGYIWLGAGDPRVQRAMKYLSRPPYEYFFEPESQDSAMQWPPPNHYAAALVFVLQRFKIKSSMRSPTRRHFWTLPFTTTIEDIDALLHNEWVKRVWTYQELLLSRKPILVYGNYHLDWETFAISVGSLEYASSVSIWFNLALARDTIYNPMQKSPSAHSKSPIQQRTRFMKDVQRTARRIEGLGLYLFLIPMALLAYIPVIPLVICGLVAAAMYASGQKRRKAVNDYNKLISSLMQSAASSRFDPSLSSTKVISAGSAEPTPTTTRTQITEVLADLKVTPTSVVHKSIASAVEPGILTAVDDCWSSCSRPSTSVGCFASCTSTHPTMPHPTLISFKEASDLGNPLNYKFCWGVVWALVAWIVIWIISHLLWSGCFRLSLRSLRNPSGLDDLQVSSLTSINIIDAALRRESRHVHDKAFGMQSILKKLSKGQLDCPTPDYKQELVQVFRGLNIQILTAIGHQQLLYIASLAPLAGQPCWMPDWTADIDSTWLSPDMHINDRETLDCEFQIPVKTMELVGDSLQVFAWDIYDPEWSTISFENCTNANGEEQRAIQLRNLLAALGIFAFLQASQEDDQTYVDERESLKELQHLFSVVTKQATNQVKKWLLFLQKHRQADPETTLQSMRSQPKLFQAHVAICDAFSRGHKRLFYCKHTSDFTVPGDFDKVCSFGICRDGIDMSNAKIVVIFGLYMPFLVRYREGAESWGGAGRGAPQRLVPGRLLSPIVFADSLGFETGRSGRSRFMHWECEPHQASKIILKLD